MNAHADAELGDWLRNTVGAGVGPAAGGFLRGLSMAALRADPSNYAIIRPALVQLAAKYPEYHRERVPAQLNASDEPTCAKCGRPTIDHRAGECIDTEPDELPPAA